MVVKSRRWADSGQNLLAHRHPFVARVLGVHYAYACSGLHTDVPATSKKWLAELVKNDEVHADQVVRHAALFAAPDLGFQLVHEVDDVEDATGGVVADERAGVGDAEVGLAGSGASDQHDLALVGHEAVGGEITH